LSKQSDAVGALAALDPVMEALIAEHGVARLRTTRRPPTGSRFEELAESICYQQLHGKAAATIWGRVVALVDGPFVPEAVLAVDTAALRGAGLSNAKMLSILDLAAKVADGTVRLDRLGRLADEAVIEELVVVRGIGRWTAEMFLIFSLGRLDVWPVGDLGVRAGYAKAYGLASMPSPRELDALGERFRPYRSLAAWYCWRAVETKTPGT
jgi:3-methyladenine DNA glycosylase/8-oxoguanine DNA glycosylase